MSAQKALILEQAKTPLFWAQCPLRALGQAKYWSRLKQVLQTHLTGLSGMDVQDLSKGDRVFFKSQFFRTEYGGFQQYTPVSASGLGKVPLSDIPAAVANITSAPIKTIHLSRAWWQMIVAIRESVKREEDRRRRAVDYNASAPYYADFMDIMWKKLSKMVEDGSPIASKFFQRASQYR
ncbi:hypothetical protein BT96DRAFT_996399 [Gymnopus androsaceus JB14]|uniref:Uncharacterized protein n=1 Tax=Gymnopus androsaceus JB14 TaxID=1447944 RepID=A0A6A4HG37_9AGAR|nr:hypothetical protein BT96DRAFT_996399 [Gymnopus androsaceus JB14]